MLLRTTSKFPLYDVVRGTSQFPLCDIVRNDYPFPLYDVVGNGRSISIVRCGLNGGLRHGLDDNKIAARQIRSV